MTGRGRNWFYAAFGAAAGLTGAAASRCAGGACSARMACAVPGVSVLVLGVLGRLAKPAKPAVAAEPAAPGEIVGRAERLARP